MEWGPSFFMPGCEWRSLNGYTQAGYVFRFKSSIWKNNQNNQYIGITISFKVFNHVFFTVVCTSWRKNLFLEAFLRKCDFGSDVTNDWWARLQKSLVPPPLLLIFFAKENFYFWFFYPFLKIQFLAGLGGPLRKRRPTFDVLPWAR